MVARAGDHDTDASVGDGWSGWPVRRHGEERAPRMRLLYHSEIDRIGAASVAGAIEASGASWCTLGRNTVTFAGASAPPAPLADPRVSREQLRVRWLADRRLFEIEPVEGARRGIAWVNLDALPASDPPVAKPIREPTLLEPGSVIAIGDRILLCLELTRVRERVDRMGLVGESEPLWALHEDVRSVARFGGSVLVTGPTGTGKELVARAIHGASPRGANAFVAMNCAALPAELAEATLFGHRRGAFTGAGADSAGIFRAADGGTLFLDELGELPLAVQPKLLRVLQDGMVIPLGAHEGRAVDVRIVAATNRDLEALVAAGLMREDLYHRVAAHVVRVPSLASRRTDVPELFVHVLRKLRRVHPELAWMWDAGSAWKPAFPIGFMAQLMRAPWTGNVRELQNFAERTARLNLRPGPFQAPDLPADKAPHARGAPDDEAIRAAAGVLGVAPKTARKLLAAATSGELDAGSASREELREAAAACLLSLLEHADFNQTSVAASLGTSRTTLIKLMDDLGLSRAADLDADEIERARLRAGGSLEATARLLRVSLTALKKRLTVVSARPGGAA